MVAFDVYETGAGAGHLFQPLDQKDMFLRSRVLADPELENISEESQQVDFAGLLFKEFKQDPVIQVCRLAEMCI